MSKLTTIDVIAEWLKSRMGRVVGSYELETAIPQYSMLFHQRPITPGTVNRKFRNLRSDGNLQASYGLSIKEEPQHGKESKWRVAPYSTSSPSAAPRTEQPSSVLMN